MASKPESPAGRAANELGQPEADLSDEAARKAVEGIGEGARPPSDPPPAAGPHAEPGLQNPDATPGAGTLPSEGGQGDEAEAPGG
jgi:hypothetical protein